MRIAAGRPNCFDGFDRIRFKVQEIIKPAYLHDVYGRYVFVAEDLLRRADRHRHAVSICNADSKRRGAHGTGKTTGGKA
jgi:hypothetical protein